MKKIVCKSVLSKSCEVCTGCVGLMTGTLNGESISHYILQKKSCLFWTFICIIDFVRCIAVNLQIRCYHFLRYLRWFQSCSVSCVEWAQLSLLCCFYRTALICGVANEMRWSLCSWKGQWYNGGRESRANDITINWSYGRFYAVECLPCFIGIQNCLSVDKSVLV